MKTIEKKSYDYIFIGMGAANCLLLLQLFDKGLLSNKNLAIIEPNQKKSNDRTFCFWATEEHIERLNLQKIITYSWDNLEINQHQIENIAPLKYFHAKGIDLYEKTNEAIKECTVDTFPISLENKQIEITDTINIQLENQSIYTQKVFDSRPPKFKAALENDAFVWQSFLGWKIKFDTPFLDKNTAKLMDFSVPQGNATQFMYLLPFSNDTALFEITRFGKEILSQHEAEKILKAYIEPNNIRYEILEIENGCLPMTSCSLDVPDFGKNWINTGTRANLMKPSTGFAFRNIAEDAVLQSELVSQENKQKSKPRQLRFMMYDRLLLNILEKKPQEGKKIFKTLFKNVDYISILHFLNEETSIFKEISIFLRLPVKIFVHTALNDIFYSIKQLPITLIAFFFTIFTLFFYNVHAEIIPLTFLLLGFLAVGMPHGAIDYIFENNDKEPKITPLFIVNFLAKSAIIGLLWFSISSLALLFFILYSAWHFGQTDFQHWKLKTGKVSFLYGLAVLVFLFATHFTEFISVLNQIPKLNIGETFQNHLPNSLQLAIAAICFGFLFAVGIVSKSSKILITALYLLLCSGLPLLVSFAIYFIWQHSVHGWQHLAAHSKHKTSFLWRKSQMFSIAGILIMAAVFFLYQENGVGLSFILLSCFSFPHVLNMNNFYIKNRKNLEIEK